jgi:hypothetical protein
VRRQHNNAHLRGTAQFQESVRDFGNHGFVEGIAYFGPVERDDGRFVLPIY